jgi:iron complex outermembrane receptor protein
VGSVFPLMRQAFVAEDYRCAPLLLASLISSIVIVPPLPTSRRWRIAVGRGDRHLRQNRRTVDSESPIDIIGARELQASGSTELATVLAACCRR